MADVTAFGESTVAVKPRDSFPLGFVSDDPVTTYDAINHHAKLRKTLLDNPISFRLLCCPPRTRFLSPHF